MNQIERDVYVLMNAYKEPIEMAQGTDGIPVIFYFRDYDIPNGTTAIVIVKKSSGKEIQDSAVVDATGNKISVDVIAQMTAEAGNAVMQVQITHNGKNIYTFNHPMFIEKSSIAIDSESGSSILEKYLEDVSEAIANAEEALRKAEEAKQLVEQKAANGEFSASIRIGETLTGEPGSAAEVTNTGTVKDAILNFKIPKGAQGESGVMVPTSGMFTLYLDPETGNLYVEYMDGDEPPVFELDETGNLYFITGEGE